MPTPARVAEIIVARVAPGAVQLVSIVLLGRILSEDDYGVFSTGLATASFLAILLTGPIQFSIVPRHAASVAQGEGYKFESNALWLLILMTAVIACFGVIASGVGFFDTSWVALAVSSGLVSGWLPVLRARMQFWRYAAAAMTNALLLFILILSSVAAAPGVVSANWAFALSGAISFAAAWGLCGAPLPRVPDRRALRNMFGVGASFTTSSIAENGLFLGTRYIIFWFGSPGFLGLFSFAIDLAQRSVGVVINIASFALVPQAYQFASVGREAAFRALLVRGGSIAGTVSFMIFTFVVTLETAGLLGRVLGDSFSLVTFGAVSTAIIANRLKKMVLDPFAVRRGLHVVIPLAYGFVTPFAIAASYVFVQRDLERVILVIYPAAYLLVVAFTAAALRARGDTG